MQFSIYSLFLNDRAFDRLYFWAVFVSVRARF
jgi:hypothetical protein